MKTKFLLMLLALSGIYWSANSASATTIATTLTDRQNANLSQTMAELIGFDRDTYSLVEIAIDRALIAQQVNINTIQMRTAGVPIATPPDSQQSKIKPAIGGKWDAPPEPKIGQVKHEKPTLKNNQSAGDIIKIKKK